MRQFCLIFLCIFGFTLAACQEPTARSGQVVVSGKADIGGPFTLVNQDGETVTEATYLGKPQLIYFGFSFCPDICPMALQQMGAVQEQLDPKGDKLNYIFFSVDPERDTPESLKPYVGANGFPKGLVGLTGTQEQVDVAKSEYRIYSAKAFDPESAADYTVNHVSIIYLMDEQGEMVDLFTHESSVKEIADRVKQHLKSGR